MVRLYIIKVIVESVPKDAIFLKIEHIPDLLKDEKVGKTIEIIDFTYFSNRTSFWRDPVDNLNLI